MDPRITERSREPGYYFYLSNQLQNNGGLFQKSIELETDVILSNNNYSLQFCEMQTHNISYDNVGATNVTIQASFGKNSERKNESEIASECERV